MTTKLTKEVSRVSMATTIRDGGKERPLVVTLYPNGTIGVRPQGTRREEVYPLEAVYHGAVRARVIAARAKQK